MISPDKARELRDNATLGDWFSHSAGDTASTNPNGAHFLQGPREIYVDKSRGYSAEDAAIIAAAPEMAETIIKQGEEVESMRAALQEAEARLQVAVAALIEIGQHEQSGVLSDTNPAQVVEEALAKIKAMEAAIHD